MPHITRRQPQQRLSSIVDGEVRKVDKDRGRVTLKHGPISNLDGLKPCDKVKFTADNSNGTVTCLTLLAIARI